MTGTQKRRTPLGQGAGFEVEQGKAPGSASEAYTAPPHPAIAAATAAVEELLSQAEPSASYCSAMREVIRNTCPCTPETQDLVRRLGDARWKADRRNGRIDPETGRTILVDVRARMTPPAFRRGPTRPTGGNAA